MTIKTDQQQNKCGLCGKLIKEQQENKSAIYVEVITELLTLLTKMSAC